MVGKIAHSAREIKAIYTQDERLRSKGMAWNDMVNVESSERLMMSLRSKLEKLKEDEWMYSSVDTLYRRDRKDH